MSKDKMKSYVFEIVLLFLAFFALFMPNVISKITLAGVLSIYTVIVCKFLKKRNILSTKTKQVVILMTILGFVYVAFLYCLGLYFGFYHATVKFNFWGMIHYIFPYTVIILSTEVLREVFLAQKIKYSKFLTFLSMVLLDIVLFVGVYDLSTLDDVLTMIGLIVFSSIACNLFYNYVSIRFGKKPIIFYRLITTLYVYVIPITPDLYMFFRTFIRLVYPYLAYFLLEYTYAKSEKVVSFRTKKRNQILNTVLIVLLCLFVMLISCRFKVGMLVIGSGSMTGAINKGDAILFLKLSGEEVNVGDVIVFQKDNIDIVHRVVEIKEVNGVYHYFTKGDANEEKDEGYILKEQIVGIAKSRIKYIGYPTLWVRDLFQI